MSKEAVGTDVVGEAKTDPARPQIGPADPNPLAGNWKLLSKKMKERWAALTDADLQFVDQNMTALVAKVHGRTGLDLDTAERQLAEIITAVGPGPSEHKA